MNIWAEDRTCAGHATIRYNHKPHNIAAAILMIFQKVSNHGAVSAGLLIGVWAAHPMADSVHSLIWTDDVI